MSSIREASAVDRANREFWNELCGTSLARSLGIRDHSTASLKRFDEAYLGLYPYLLDHVPPARLAGQTVLEVGLGYGTLGQKLAEAGARYVGLDLAPGPVAMMAHRLEMHGLPGQAIRGSVLECPLRSSSIDHVVAIGCFHHTGNVQRAFDETLRVLRPGGTATLMLYNQFSYRQWLAWPGRTLKAAFAQMGRTRPREASLGQRRTYDANVAGQAAPETVFLSVRALRRMMSAFSEIVVTKENCGDFSLGVPVPFTGKQLGVSLIPRRKLLPTLGRRLGLDLYVKARK